MQLTPKSRASFFFAWTAGLLALVLMLAACSGDSSPSAVRAPGERAASHPAGPHLAWTFERDPAGRVVKDVDPAGRATTTRYDLHPNGRVQRLTRELSDGSTLVNELDPFGRRLRETRGAWASEYQHDGLDHLVAVRRKGLPALSYAYDTLDRVVSQTLGTRETRYRYDILGRLKELTTPWGSISYDYLPADGLVVRTLPTGHRSVWKYDVEGHLLSLEHSDRQQQLLARYTYERRPDGRIRRVRELRQGAEGTTSYEYDGMGRLTAAKESARGNVTYHYDSTGNRVASIYPDGKKEAASYDWAMRLLEHAGKACRHDDAGNLAGCEALGTGYTHGADGLLSRVERGGTAVEYARDAEGLLVARTAGSKRTTFFPDPTTQGWRPLLSTDERGAETLYLWEGDTVLGAATGNQLRLFLGDQLGSVRFVVDAKGTVSTRDYDAFGAPLGTPANGLEPGFAGLFFDSTAGVYLTRTRAYEPTIGRFLERDPELRVPSGSAEDLSAYAYCGDDPINGIDPTGAAKQDPPWHEVYKNVQYITIPKVDFTKFGLTHTAGYRGGRGGNESTRLLNQLIVHDYERQGWTLKHVTGMRGEAGSPYKELYLPRLPGVSRDEAGGKGNFIDIVMVKGDQTAFISTQSTDPQGAKREAAQDASVLAKLAHYSAGRPGPNGPGSPSNVGGVALGGAGAALGGLGQLEGVGIDANNRIVLLSKQSGTATLPAMQIDDVVTVFRSVYDHAEAPLVSIDPQQDNPTGPTLVVRHGAGTARTYVGWVLFEADRLMKSFSLGIDNVTKAPMHTSIPGYRSVTAMTGASGKVGGPPVWERFWIVPASTAERASASGALSLFDVSLRVNTEVEELKGGKLQPAPRTPPSPAAQQFAAWFSANYPALEREGSSRLPAGHHRSYEQVNVFAELRRIAVLTAAAEKLRDDGVPMPGWMRARPPESFPAPLTTPSASVVSTQGNIEVHVAGGVSLTSPPGGKKRLPGSEANEAEKSVFAALPPPSSAPLAKSELPGSSYKAVVLPGAGTRDVGALVMAEEDLSAPVAEGGAIRLVRHFQSFSQPSGDLGQGWTLDLPSLSERLEPVDQPGPPGQRALRKILELTTPLGTYAARFNRQATVQELGGIRMLAPGRPSNVVGLAMIDEGKIVFLRGGRQLVFNESGRLIKEVSGGSILKYRWDGAQQLTTIEAIRQGSVAAAIRFEHDTDGRISAASSTGGGKVRYTYSGGLLAHVESERGALRYVYRDGRLAEVWNGGKRSRSIDYDADGRVAADDTGGHVRRYTYTADGVGIEVVTDDGPEDRETIKYDAFLRPLQGRLADGTSLQWNQGAGGGVRTSATLPGGDRWTLDRSKDGRSSTWTSPAGGALEVATDEIGRTVAVNAGVRPVARYAWHPAGQLQSVTYETAMMVPNYGQDGTLDSLILAPPGEKKTTDWFEIKWNAREHTMDLRDSAKLHTTLRTDAAGRTSSVSWGRDRFEVKRDGPGRVTAIQTSWGDGETYTYADQSSNTLAKVERIEDGARLAVEYRNGQPVLFRSFEGDETKLSYVDAGNGPQKPSRIELPGNVEIGLVYDSAGAPANVTCAKTFQIHYSRDAHGLVSEVYIEPYLASR